MKTSQILGPLPSLLAMPSTWYAEVAVPNINPDGNDFLLKPPRSSWSSENGGLVDEATAARIVSKRKQRICLAAIFSDSSQKRWTNRGKRIEERRGAVCVLWGETGVSIYRFKKGCEKNSGILFGFWFTHWLIEELCVFKVFFSLYFFEEKEIVFLRFFFSFIFLRKKNCVFKVYLFIYF